MSARTLLVSDDEDACSIEICDPVYNNVDEIEEIDDGDLFTAETCTNGDVSHNSVGLIGGAGEAALNPRLPS